LDGDEGDNNKRMEESCDIPKLFDSLALPLLDDDEDVDEEDEEDIINQMKTLDMRKKRTKREDKTCILRFSFDDSSI
jgi:hypothetical protein